MLHVCDQSFLDENSTVLIMKAASHCKFCKLYLIIVYYYRIYKYIYMHLLSSFKIIGVSFCIQLFYTRVKLAYQC